jgi:uncharacterized protein (TIGR00106 family)
MAMVAISISPSGVGASVGEYVAEALRVLKRQTDVRWEVGPMFTTVEGDLRRILDLVLEMEEAVFAMGAQRVGTVLKIDDRRDQPLTMEGKLDRIQRLLENESG